jgi:conjugal transfer pilus assembly protein TraF
MAKLPTSPTIFILFVIIFFLLDLFLLNFLAANDAHARRPNYCEEYGLGFNFYCQDEKKEAVLEEKKSTPENQDDYAEKLAEVKKTLENKKAKAVMYPTEDNIKDYMAYQQAILNQSGTFADQWRRVLWKTPELDYTLKRPVSKVGKESWIDKRNSDVASAVRHINDRYGIFFLFRGDCPHCHRYSPILKDFQQKYGINIMAVSMDGGSLPEWDKFMVNHGQIARMGIDVQQVPTTLLFDKTTRKVIMIGSGVLSHSDLEERIYAQTKLEVGDDF